MDEVGRRIPPVTREQVRRAFARVNLRYFVPLGWQEHAEANVPLPIGWGQTTSQPSLIAWMICLLALRPGERVLEIGTGSGYQTAILAELGCAEVFSIEIVPELAHQAAERLEQLGYSNIHLRVGDGFLGWAEHAPYDAILVSAACPEVSPAWGEQLADRGRIVIPLETPEGWQLLWRFFKEGNLLRGEPLEEVAFVPLTRKATSSFQHVA
jgi:protein-L-isoaspartate(D-aspartate) O-methyltransferase